MGQDGPWTGAGRAGARLPEGLPTGAPPTGPLPVLNLTRWVRYSFFSGGGCEQLGRSKKERYHFWLQAASSFFPSSSMPTPGGLRAAVSFWVHVAVISPSWVNGLLLCVSLSRLRLSKKIHEK